MSQIHWLEQLSLADRAQAGGKAALLGELARAGLPVPPGFCIPAPALERLETPHDALWGQVLAAYRRLVGELRLPGWPPGETPPVAVRSSGAGEDGPAHSFAGQYETVLNVTGEAALWDAVQRCRQAALHPRVQVYRLQAGRAALHEDRPAGAGDARSTHQAGKTASPHSADPGFAILIQAQAPAQVSGVLFTVNPLTGDSRELLIEAAPGLGEALVGGKVAPVSYRLPRRAGRPLPGQPDLLSSEQLAILARLARQVEALLGAGQDIEWAAAGGQVYLLQARPVTSPPQALASNAPPPAAPLPSARRAAGLWTRANVGEVLPHVVTPLTWSVFTHTLLAGQPVAHPGQDESAFGLRRFRGRVYLRLDVFLDTFCYLPGVSPHILAQVLGVDLPPDLETYRPPAGPAVRLAQGLFYLDAYDVLDRLDRLASTLPALPQTGDEPALLDWVGQAFRLHLKATAYAIAAYALLVHRLQRWAGPGAAALLPELLLGEEDLQTAAQGHELWELTTRIRQNWPLQRLVETSRSWPELAGMASLAPGGAAFLIEMERFLQANGARAACEFELATPRWREDPSFLLDVLRTYLARDERHARTYAERRTRQQAVLDDLHTRLPQARRRLLDRYLAAYRRYATHRENLKYRLMEGFAALRSHYLELGGRLHSQGLLPEAQAIFFLNRAQIAGLQDASQADLPSAQSVIQAARSQDLQWRSLPSLGDLIDNQGQAVAAASGPHEDCLLTGIAASPGRVAGRARVLQDIDQLNQLQPGEILVTPHTDPGWTPIFMSCTAVVTEIGGFLSHGATVAREYGLPCVVNVSGATSRIRTGDWIQVDGQQGRVSICPPEERMN